jgi:hypothetical protein
MSLTASPSTSLRAGRPQTGDILLRHDHSPPQSKDDIARMLQSEFRFAELRLMFSLDG